MEEIALPGGNVGGAVRVGDTVRRPTGPWTPAVHGLLQHLADHGLSGVPRVHGFDAQGREILDYLPGDAYTEPPADDVLATALSWLRQYHRVVASYRPAGVVQWRTSLAELKPDEIVCMHDFGYYNWIGDKAGFVGVIDWDMAGPGKPLDDIAFAAWNSVPLATPASGEPVAASYRAARLRMMAEAYGDIDPLEILKGATARMARSVRVIRAGQVAGDPGMLNLGKVGEPERTERQLADLDQRIPEIAAHL
ncbi:phosphotransferase [Kribbella deserti]|uniref:Phosphotransferase n=1 Tax=Kribbella deserti TaxID=1926257 RepID=A0ABV6QRI7_9ACTN